MPDKRTLLRRESKCDFDFDTYDSEQEIGFNIESLVFSYFDGQDWQADLEALPKAVKVDLTLSYRRFSASYQDIINIPVGE